ncbi:hypothetical protein RTBOTA2_006456 [Rhodotorula toruloides]|nr:hypothetical protein RTBOTA2_006456 [Rhodotorula toruloides]
MTRKRRNGKAKRAPAPRLPAELVEYIVGFLDPSERPRCLARLSRVSRHFRKTTQWLLYERICIRFEDVEEHRGANWPYEGKKREKWDSSPLWRLGASSVKCLATLRDSFSLAEMLVAPTLTSLVLDYYHCAPRDYWHEKAYGDDNLPFLPLRRLKSVTVVLRHQTTELNVIGGFVSWPTAGEATFQADFDHLCDLLGTLPRENPVVPKLRLPPLIPAHFRELDHEFWTKVFKERKKPERADQARRVDSSLA